MSEGQMGKRLAESKRGDLSKNFNRPVQMKIDY